jgi:hypothetical protein
LRFIVLSSGNGAAAAWHCNGAAGVRPDRSREWKPQGYQIALPRKAADGATHEAALGSGSNQY